MQDQIAIDQAAPNLMFGERSEIDYLCNRFGLSRNTARNIVHGCSGDRNRMEQEAARLAIYEHLHARGDRR